MQTMTRRARPDNTGVRPYRMIRICHWFVGDRLTIEPTCSHFACAATTLSGMAVAGTGASR